MKEKVYIEEAGCNRRKLDIHKIRVYLKSNEYELVDRPEDADKILVETCAFKKLEEDESMQRLRHFKKYGTKMVVYGCLPDIAHDRYNREFADIPKVAPREMEKIEQFFPGTAKNYSKITDGNIIGNSNENILKSFFRVLQTRPTINREFWHWIKDAVRKKYADFLYPQAATYYLFVCRGCMGKCTYCAIRNAIGTVRSKPIATVVAEFQRGVSEGYRDFTILGDDPGCYGIDMASSLPEMLQVLFTVDIEAEKTKSKTGPAQKEISFHICEIHPKFLIPYTNKFLSMERFSSVRSIQCPIQSGSDRILELMQREHTAEQLEEAVKQIRAKLPQIILYTDIIIGFPSETEEDFQKSLDWVVRCQFNSVVIFPYDEKSRAASTLLPDKVPMEIIEKRMHKAFKFFAKAGIPAYYKGGYANEAQLRAKFKVNTGNDK